MTEPRKCEGMESSPSSFQGQRTQSAVAEDKVVAGATKVQDTSQVWQLVEGFICYTAYKMAIETYA